MKISVQLYLQWESEEKGPVDFHIYIDILKRTRCESSTQKTDRSIEKLW